ncbi:MAG: KOW motif-containing protein [Patescibacteria group bacterium]
MAIAKIQAGDNVKIVAGSYKGTEGVVTEVITITKGKKIFKRVVVSSLPTIVKYQKANKAFDMPGSQTQTSRKIDISNVMLITDGKITRSKIVTDEKGKKTREYLKTAKTVKKTILPRSKDSKEIKNTKDKE